MTHFKKEISIPMIPIFIEQWIQDNFDDLTYQQYIEASRIHQEIVQSAIDAGDCIVAEGDGVDKRMNIHWTSEEVHMEYMSKIPHDSHSFYMKMWALYYEAANTNVQVTLKE